MQLNEAVSLRIRELLEKEGITQYQLYRRTGVPQSTIGNVIHCAYPSIKLRVLHELCQGFNIDLPAFFDSPLFKNENLDP